MFDELTDKLEQTFARLRGKGTLTEADIKEGLREVRRVLLEADVNFTLTREFLERVEKAAVGVAQLKGVNPAQQLVKIVYDELTAMLGERREGLKLGTIPPTVVMMVGLQGSGKTTTAGQPPPRAKGGCASAGARAAGWAPSRRPSSGWSASRARGRRRPPASSPASSRARGARRASS